MKNSPIPDRNRLYGDLAWTWPIISPPEHYIRESEDYHRLILEYSLIDPDTLLNLGCGGGHNDFTLKKHFKVTGVDVSDKMLNLARSLNPEINYLTGDMRAVNLGKTFDAVTLFDSAVYMLTETDLRAVFHTAYLHLKPGGVFLTYNENDPALFKQNKVHYTVAQQGGLEIVFIENQYDPLPGDGRFEATMLYLIRRAGQLQIETDRHLVGMFENEIWAALLEETGFQDVIPLNRQGEDFVTFLCVKALET